MTSQRRAASRYRQLRLTCTQEVGGRVSYSISAKGLNENWNEHHVMVRDTVATDGYPLASTEDVVRLLLVVLREQLLPGSID
uniref:Uncharacterized protein n=1 Tax=uncultured prokaryote TaxID=198431 RepID=A0A0H5Q7P8_9ZZZZ|nr:hypothetical protein [uncultured prokaryote]